VNLLWLLMRQQSRAAFNPSQLSALSAWLRLAGGTVTGVGYSSVPDILNPVNPAVQTVDARRPTNGTSSNGLPIANFVTANATCWVWPSANNNNNALTTKAGFAGWFKFTTYTGIFKCIFEIGGSTGAYDNSKFEVYIDSSRRVNLYHFGVDTGGYNGRNAQSPFNSVPVAGTWFFLRWQFNGGNATEALRSKTYINEIEVTNTFSNVGSGGTPLTLRTGLSSIPSILGSFGDNDNTYAIAGAFGPNTYLLKDDLTAAEGTALMNFEKPT
jgi:hypothetical protein